MKTYRRERLTSLLHRLIADIISRDYGEEGSLITVASVELNTASDHAKVFISILPPNRSRRLFTELKNQTKTIEWLLVKKMPIRPVPTLEFILDDGLPSSARVEKLLEDK